MQCSYYSPSPLPIESRDPRHLESRDPVHRSTAAFSLQSLRIAPPIDRSVDLDLGPSLILSVLYRSSINAFSLSALSLFCPLLIIGRLLVLLMIGGERVSPLPLMIGRKAAKKEGR